MPISVSAPLPAFTLYYNIAGNNNDKSHPQYRSNNPWQTAKKFCGALSTNYPSVISATSVDDSVFIVQVQPNNLPNLQVIATQILNDLAVAIQPSMAGDNLVAAIPTQQGLVEVHHTP